MIPENAIYVSPVECYHLGRLDENGLRGRFYVDAAGECWITSEGNGCGDDIPLVDLAGVPIDAINETFRFVDLDVIASDRDNLRELGRGDLADWLDGWIHTCESARRGVVVELDHMGDEATYKDRDRLIEALHANGYTWARLSRGAAPGDLSGITDAEWDRVMAETFNK